FLDEHGGMLWRHYLGHRIFSVYALDIDNDGQIEVLAGSDDSRVHTIRVRLQRDRKSTRLNSSHVSISYAVFCLKKKNIVYAILAFHLFELVYIMKNGGGPNNATITIEPLIYSMDFHFGLSRLSNQLPFLLFSMS